MPRRTRKQLIVEDEELERQDREDGYRRLGVELRRAWREAQQSWPEVATSCIDQ
jgi:hypothetical protein